MLFFISLCSLKKTKIGKHSIQWPENGIEWVGVDQLGLKNGQDAQKRNISNTMGYNVWYFSQNWNIFQRSECVKISTLSNSLVFHWKCFSRHNVKTSFTLEENNKSSHWSHCFICCLLTAVYLWGYGLHKPACSKREQNRDHGPWSRGQWSSDKNLQNI